MNAMDTTANHKLWLRFFTTLDEDKKRKFAAIKAKEMGWGGITTVSKITGISPTTIRKGMQEIENPENLELTGRIRKQGGGRKKISEKDPALFQDLEAILDENTAGDPMRLLKWTTKSTYNLAEELIRLGHTVSAETVRRLLKENNYSLQANAKTKEGGSRQDRDAQFHYINNQVELFIQKGNPVISVDTKKREFVGEFKNPGKTWRKKGKPRDVNVYDFRSLGIGIAIPYGTYDIQRNEGFVNVGVSSDTSEFAVESIRQWWNLVGKANYPDAKELLICADGGGSNGSRRRGWKFFLKEFADQIGIPISVSHFPPGTSKWNKIEHRMFSFISIKWKGEPLVNYETIINHISSTTTKKGLTIVAILDEREYGKGRKFSDEEMAKVKLKKHDLFPKWNYTVGIKNNEGFCPI